MVGQQQQHQRLQQQSRRDVTMTSDLEIEAAFRTSSTISTTATTSPFNGGSRSSQTPPPPAPVWPGSRPSLVVGSAGGVSVQGQIQRLQSQMGRKQQQQPLLYKSKETSNSHVPFTFMSRNPKFVHGIGMFGGKTPLNLFDVARNENYVSRIQIGSGNIQSSNPLDIQQLQQKQQQQQQQLSSDNKRVYGLRYRRMSPIGETMQEQPTSPLSPDSIVTDSLLQMTSFSSSQVVTTTSVSTGYEPAILEEEQDFHEDDDDIDEDILDQEGGNSSPVKPGFGMVKKNEDMDKVIKELSQAVTRSRNVSTLTRAMAINGSSALGSVRSSFKRNQRLRNSAKALKRSLTRNQGVGAVRELWQKTGMITNGRKLLVDSLSEEDEKDEASSGGDSAKKARKRRYCKHHGKRIPTHPGSLSSSAASSSVSSLEESPYQMPFKASGHRSQSSTDLYDDVYKSSSDSSKKGSSSSSSSQYPSHVINGLETVDLDDLESSKRVKFRKDVVDNEALFKPKLIYDKLPMVSKMSRSRGDLIIDISKLNEREGYGSGGFGLAGGSGSSHQEQWEKYYGTSGKFSGDPAGKEGGGASRSGSSSSSSGGSQKNKGSSGSSSADYRTIFTSPYFDYRRTHSKVCVSGFGEFTSLKIIYFLCL